MSNSNDAIQTEQNNIIKPLLSYSFRDQTEIEVQKSNFRLTDFDL